MFIVIYSGFLKGSDLVPVRLKDRRCALVNRKGEVVRELPDRSESVNDDGNMIIDDYWYDAYGNKVDKVNKEVFNELVEKGLEYM